MRSPLLTYFRWWPRNLQARQHTVSSNAYATLAIGEHFGRIQSDAEAEYRTTKPALTANRSRSGTLVKPEVRTCQNNLDAAAVEDGKTKASPLSDSDSAELCASLERQRLRHGFKGIEAVWRRLEKQRPILRPDNPDALRMWQCLLMDLKNRRDLLEGLVEYAGHVRKLTGADFRFMYHEIMSDALRREPESSLDLFALMENHGLVPANRASRCVSDTVHSKDPAAAFRAFRHIYETGGERNLYDTSFRELEKSSASYRTIYKWHTMLLSHGDLPSTALLSNPMVKILLSRSQRLPFAKDLVLGAKPAGHTVNAQDLPRFTRDYMNTIVGDVHDIKQKSVSDAFCARVLATGGLSTSFLVAGLAILGLDTIGPLALREVAAKARTTTGFLEDVRIIAEREIGLTPCIFSDALQKFAEDGRQDLFDGLVHSDRHPDIYEDRELLERLAGTYLKSTQSKEAYVILAVLALTSDQNSLRQWNTLAQAECDSHQPLRVANILQDMIGQKTEVTDRTIACVRHNLLRQRAPGKRPRIAGRRRKDIEDDLTSTTNLLLSVARAGKQVEVSHWRELIKRYGMEGRMAGLRHLALELVHLHQVRSSASEPGLPVQRSRVDHPSRELFNPVLQKAILDWGFRSETSERWLPPALKSPESENSGPGEKWLRGLTLLVDLRDAGVSIDVGACKEEITKQLGKLYGPRLVRAGGRRVISNNDAELMRRYQLIEQAWGGKGLFRCAGSQQGQDQTAWVLSCLFDRSGWISQREHRRSRFTRSRY